MSIADKLQTIAENVSKVYEAGKRAGGGSSGDSGTLNWDAYQKNGNRTDYKYAFYSDVWTDESFKPKYDLKIESAVQMFGTSAITNLEQCLAHLNNELDFSDAGVSSGSAASSYVMTSASNVFANSTITHLPIINLDIKGNEGYTNPVHFNKMFNNMHDLKSVRGIKAQNRSVYLSTTFQGCENLEEIYEFDCRVLLGPYSAPIYLNYSDKLSHDTILRVFNKLYDGGGTLYLGSANLEKMTEEEIAIATGKGWTVT